MSERSAKRRRESSPSSQSVEEVEESSSEMESVVETPRPSTGQPPPPPPAPDFLARYDSLDLPTSVLACTERMRSLIDALVVPGTSEINTLARHDLRMTLEALDARVKRQPTSEPKKSKPAVPPKPITLATSGRHATPRSFTVAGPSRPLSQGSTSTGFQVPAFPSPQENKHDYLLDRVFPTGYFQERVPIYEYVSTILVKLVDNLGISNPGHPIFGELTDGKYRAPLRKKGGADWIKKMDQIARGVEKTMRDSEDVVDDPPTMVRGSCWMISNVDSYSFQRGAKEMDRIEKETGTRPPQRYKTLHLARLLAFFANPTPVNWDALIAQEEGKGKSYDTPFCHDCGNGVGSKEGRKDRPSCINGVEHGSFATVKVNNTQKGCKNSSREACPGHKDLAGFKHWCIFVREDGSPIACRNKIPRPLTCECGRGCFGNIEAVMASQTLPDSDPVEMEEESNSEMEEGDNDNDDDNDNIPTSDG